MVRPTWMARSVAPVATRAHDEALEGAGSRHPNGGHAVHDGARRPVSQQVVRSGHSSGRSLRQRLEPSHPGRSRPTRRGRAGAPPARRNSGSRRPERGRGHGLEAEKVVHQAAASRRGQTSRRTSSTSSGLTLASISSALRSSRARNGPSRAAVRSVEPRRSSSSAGSRRRRSSPSPTRTRSRVRSRQISTVRAAARRRSAAGARVSRTAASSASASASSLPSVAASAGFASEGSEPDATAGRMAFPDRFPGAASVGRSRRPVEDPYQLSGSSEQLATDRQATCRSRPREVEQRAGDLGSNRDGFGGERPDACDPGPSAGQARESGGDRRVGELLRRRGSPRSRGSPRDRAAAGRTGIGRSAGAAPRRRRTG